MKAGWGVVYCCEVDIKQASLPYSSVEFKVFRVLSTL